MLDCAYDYKDIIRTYCNKYFLEFKLLIMIWNYDLEVSITVKESLKIFNVTMKVFGCLLCIKFYDY